MKITPMRAIRKKCLDCSNHQYKEVRLCPVELCPLWVYRHGRKPKVGGSVQPNTETEKTTNVGK